MMSNNCLSVCTFFLWKLHELILVLDVCWKTKQSCDDSAHEFLACAQQLQPAVMFCQHSKNENFGQKDHESQNTESCMWQWLIEFVGAFFTNCEIMQMSRFGWQCFSIAWDCDKQTLNLAMVFIMIEFLIWLSCFHESHTVWNAFLAHSACCPMHFKLVFWWEEWPVMQRWTLNCFQQFREVPCSTRTSSIWCSQKHGASSLHLLDIQFCWNMQSIAILLCHQRWGFECCFPFSMIPRALPLFPQENKFFLFKKVCEKVHDRCRLKALSTSCVVGCGSLLPNKFPSI